MCSFSYRDDPLDFFLVLALLIVPFCIALVFTIKTIVIVKLMLEYETLVEELKLFIRSHVFYPSLNVFLAIMLVMRSLGQLVGVYDSSELYETAELCLINASGIFSMVQLLRTYRRALSGGVRFGIDALDAEKVFPHTAPQQPKHSDTPVRLTVTLERASSQPTTESRRTAPSDMHEPLLTASVISYESLRKTSLNFQSFSTENYKQTRAFQAQKLQEPVNETASDLRSYDDED